MASVTLGIKFERRDEARQRARLNGHKTEKLHEAAWRQLISAALSRLDASLRPDLSATGQDGGHSTSEVEHAAA